MDIWGAGGSDVINSGMIPANRSSFAVKGAMHHPDACFSSELEKTIEGERSFVG